MLAQISASPAAASAQADDLSGPPTPALGNSHMLDDQNLLRRATHCANLLYSFKIPDLHQLVCLWLERGMNLSIAEPLVAACNDTVLEFSSADNSLATRSVQAKALLENSHRPMLLTKDSSIAEYVAQIIGDRLRWETAGLFLAAASRAVLDTQYFRPLYSSERQRRPLIQTLTQACDSCLEICLALDCLNELQFILQHENFMVHTHVHGDQSRRTPCGHMRSHNAWTS
jgi:hypothetical protein